MENHTALEDRTVLVDNTKFSGETIEHIFCQTSVNDQRQKLKIMDKWLHNWEF